MTTTAYATFVALDDLGKPTAVPPLTPETDEEQARQVAARQRKQDRMARRQQARGA
jgi:acyl-CoA hydrolase